jgi:rhamnopyranosyl-N-acetylglucosaminyl-diphospho-decaprenol beta-1,3/1,4-galactofuranosyltransferase
VFTVVVTYNRLDLLKRNIYSLREQTKEINALLVINNGSTDGTKEWLEEQEDIIVISQENLGGAGGFARGFKEAFERGADWVWAMDDDGVLDKFALEAIVTQNPEPNEILCTLPVDIVNHSSLSWPINTIQHGTLLSTSDFSATSEKLSVDSVPFLGIFIHRTTFKKIGYPKIEFFIRHDDTEFCLRFRKSLGTDIFIVPSSKIYHKKTEVLTINLLFTKFTFGLEASPLMRRYMLRNETAMWKLHSSKFRFITYYLPRITIKLVLTIFFNKNLKFKEIPTLVQDIINGANLKLGKL